MFKRCYFLIYELGTYNWRVWYMPDDWAHTYVSRMKPVLDYFIWRRGCIIVWLGKTVRLQWARSPQPGHKGDNKHQWFTGEIQEEFIIHQGRKSHATRLYHYLLFGRYLQHTCRQKILHIDTEEYKYIPYIIDQHLTIKEHDRDGRVVQTLEHWPWYFKEKSESDNPERNLDSYKSYLVPNI